MSIRDQTPRWCVRHHLFDSEWNQALFLCHELSYVLFHRFDSEWNWIISEWMESFLFSSLHPVDSEWMLVFSSFPSFCFRVESFFSSLQSFCFRVEVSVFFITNPSIWFRMKSFFPLCNPFDSEWNSFFFITIHLIQSGILFFLYCYPFDSEWNWVLCSSFLHDILTSSVKVSRHLPIARDLPGQISIASHCWGFIRLDQYLFPLPGFTRPDQYSFPLPEIYQVRSVSLPTARDLPDQISIASHVFLSIAGDSPDQISISSHCWGFTRPDQYSFPLPWIYQARSV